MKKLFNKVCRRCGAIFQPSGRRCTICYDCLVKAMRIHKRKMKIATKKTGVIQLKCGIWINKKR